MSSPPSNSASMRSPSSADTEIGTSCMFSARRVAVTMTSSSGRPPGPGPCRLPAQRLRASARRRAPTAETKRFSLPRESPLSDRLCGRAWNRARGQVAASIGGPHPAESRNAKMWPPSRPRYLVRGIACRIADPRPHHGNQAHQRPAGRFRRDRPAARRPAARPVHRRELPRGRPARQRRAQHVGLHRPISRRALLGDGLRHGYSVGIDLLPRALRRIRREEDHPRRQLRLRAPGREIARHRDRDGRLDRLRGQPDALSGLRFCGDRELRLVRDACAAGREGQTQVPRRQRVLRRSLLHARARNVRGDAQVRYRRASRWRLPASTA